MRKVDRVASWKDRFQLELLLVEIGDSRQPGLRTLKATLHKDRIGLVVRQLWVMIVTWTRIITITKQMSTTTEGCDL